MALTAEGTLPSQSQTNSRKRHPERPRTSPRLPLKSETRALPSASLLNATIHPQLPPAKEALQPRYEQSTTEQQTSKSSMEYKHDDTDSDDHFGGGDARARAHRSFGLPTPSASDAQDHRGFLIPGSRGKKLWPFMPVVSKLWTEKQYEERFEYVVLQLRRAVGSDAVLRMRAQFIDYDLTMAGQTEATACPSICIKCKKSDVRPLRKLFDETSRARLFCYRENRFAELFPNWHASKPPPKPPFQLVYFPSKSNPMIQNASSEEVILQSRYKDTLCGAIVEFRGRSATIGLTLRIDEADWILTVEHLFREVLGSEPDLSSSSIYDLAATPPGPSSDTENPPLWVNDSDDDSFASEEWSDSDDEENLKDVANCTETERSDSAGVMTESRISNTRQAVLARANDDFLGASLPSTSPVNESNLICSTLKLRDIRPEKSFREPPSSSPFLDWICLRLGPDLDLQRLRQNLVSVAQDQPSVLLEKIAEQPQRHETPVYVISGKLGIRPGTLIGRFSYLGSRFGMDMAKVWTVILESRGVVAGECGSIVLDRETYHVYGHVIGSDVLGHARVAPLAHVVDQIKMSFGTSEVIFPSHDDLVEAAVMTEDSDLGEPDLCEADFQLSQTSSTLESHVGVLQNTSVFWSNPPTQTHSAPSSLSNSSGSLESMISFDSLDFGDWMSSPQVPPQFYTPSIASRVPRPPPPRMRVIQEPTNWDIYSCAPAAGLPLAHVTHLGCLWYEDTEDGMSLPVQIHLNGDIDNGFSQKDGDWTCYRQNYFSCTCSFNLDLPQDGTPLYFTPAGKNSSLCVRGFAMSISACTSGSDSRQIGLILHAPKESTPVTIPGHVPLIPKLPRQAQLYSSSSSNLPASSDEHTFERVEFKGGTANNNKIWASQEYFQLLVELWADVGRGEGAGLWRIAYRKSARFIVREQSPGHDQADRRAETLKAILSSIDIA